MQNDSTALHVCATQGRSGTHFRKGYSESPSCIPARRTLMSGTAPAANGCVGMGGGFTQAWEPAHTLAGELSEGGYQQTRAVESFGTFLCGHSVLRNSLWNVPGYYRLYSRK